MKRLRELRQKKGLSQQALADMLHVTQQSVYKYENGLAIPELDILIHMAEIFETSIDYLVGNTDVPFKYETYDADTRIKLLQTSFFKCERFCTGSHTKRI